MNSIEYYFLEHYLTDLHEDLEHAETHLNRENVGEAARSINICAHKIADLRNFLYEIRKDLFKNTDSED